MTKTERLQQIIDHFCDGNKTNFGISVGIGNSSVHSWLSRDTFDAFLIAEAYPQIDTRWLLTGNGNMLLDSETVEPDEPSEDQLCNKSFTVITSQLAEKDEQIRTLLDIIKSMKS